MNSDSCQIHRIKIWPEVVIAGFRSRMGGAIRVWYLSRYLDMKGVGWVSKPELISLIKSLNINSHTGRRWISEAHKIGLLKSNEGRIWYKSLVDACMIVGCENIGRPVLIDLMSFVRKGWKSLTWVGLLATTNSNPISQRAMKKRTGISARSQDRYIRNRPVQTIHNIAVVGKGDSRTAQGLHEITGYIYYVKAGNIIQRLPNSYNIPSEIASPINRGRSKKTQKVLNSFFGGRGKRHPMRLFLSSRNSVENDLRELGRKDYPAWEIPDKFYWEKIERVGEKWINKWRRYID